MYEWLPVACTAASTNVAPSRRRSSSGPSAIVSAKNSRSGSVRDFRKQSQQTAPTLVVPLASKATSRTRQCSSKVAPRVAALRNSSSSSSGRRTCQACGRLLSIVATKSTKPRWSWSGETNSMPNFGRSIRSTCSRTPSLSNTGRLPAAAIRRCESVGAAPSRPAQRGEPAAPAARRPSSRRGRHRSRARRRSRGRWSLRRRAPWSTGRGAKRSRASPRAFRATPLRVHPNFSIPEGALGEMRSDVVWHLRSFAARISRGVRSGARQRAPSPKRVALHRAPRLRRGKQRRQE